MPGISYSSVKAATRGRVDPTDKMRFGSLVDTYLFEPAKYNGEQYELVRPVAQAAVQQLGQALRHARRQLVVSCTMICEGLYLKYKGRVDMTICSQHPVVLDFKVSDMPLLAAIKHFGYNHQVNGYAIPLQAKTSIIFSISPKPPYKPQMMPIPNSLIYWRQVVKQYGKPC
jgi:hypothetical protein